MKQTRELSTIDGSAMASKIVSEMVSGAITGVSSVRKLFYRAILIVAMIVAVTFFMMGMMFHDYMRENLNPPVRKPIPAAEPKDAMQDKPPPKKRLTDEELRQLIRSDAL